VNRIWWVTGILLVGLILGCTGGEEEEPEWRVPSPAPTPTSVKGIGGVKITPTTTKPPTTKPPKTATQPAPPVEDAYYASCAEAIKAGKALIRRGQPGYRLGLDRDNDGIACDK
jgi:Excalibur calcium-binding domain